MNAFVSTVALAVLFGCGGKLQEPDPDDPYYYQGMGSLGTSSASPTASTTHWLYGMSPNSTMYIATYTATFYILSFFAGSFGRYNTLAKVARWLMVVTPIGLQISGFSFHQLIQEMLAGFPNVEGHYS